MQRKSTSFLVWFLLIGVIGTFVAVLLMNASSQSDAPVLASLPTESPPTESANSISEILREGFGRGSTPLPTIAIPTQQIVIPTLDMSSGGGPPVDAAAVSGDVSDVVAVGRTPTPAPAFATAAADTDNAGDEEIEVVAVPVTSQPEDWSPPPLLPPLSRDPLGRDHFWLLRPIDSNALTSSVNSVYPYGSDGPEKENPLRVHHGIDISNPIGERVQAAGSGTVIWAADGRQSETDIFQNSPSYGNVIVIEHDFGYRGQYLWTLYAHLSAAFVQPGDRVEGGQTIGLVGNTGRVTGPHVHFEVRLGSTREDNRYSATYNPVLWMVPYVGHGVIAGRVVDASGNFVNDADITIRSRATGLPQAVTTSYVFLQTASEVNPDPVWQENFAVSDIPAGRYDVIATINGQRVVRQVNVIEGTTTFVELRPVSSAGDDDEGDD